MWLHILIILGLLILGIIFTSSNKKSGVRIYLFVAFTILFILSAFRSVSIGNDTFEYLLMFDKFGQSNNILELSTRIEIGYIVLNKVLYLLNSNPLILLIITSTFVLSVISIFIYKNSNIVWLSIFLFINFRLYYFTLSGIRQSIALAIVLISYKFLKERKLIPFVVTVILASTFHVSALLFLIVYPLSKIEFSKIMLLQYMVVGAILFLTFNSFINFAFKLFPKYRVYIKSSYFENVQIASMIEFIIILLVLLFGLLINIKHKASINNNMAANFIENKNLLFHIITLAVIINLVSINASIIQRAALYFFTFIIVFIPNIIVTIRNKKARLLIIYLIVVLTFAYNIIILIYRPEWQHVYPFEFFWQ